MMRTEVKVVTPWRPDGGQRMALWDYCRAWWRSQGVIPVEASSPDGPFNRGAAINAGLEGDWTVALVIDADVVGTSWAQGIKLAVESQRVVFPFEVYCGLAPWGTSHVLAGQPLETAGTLRVVQTHESSVIIIPRSVWDTVGGFDERFVGWGQDDVSFCQSVRVMCDEPLRTAGPVYHLWHDVAPEKDPDSPLWQSNQRLGHRYRAATTRQAMQELMWERTGRPSSHLSTSTTRGTATKA